VGGGELWVRRPDGGDLLAVGAFDLDQAGLQLMGAGEFHRRRVQPVAVDGVPVDDGPTGHGAAGQLHGEGGAPGLGEAPPGGRPSGRPLEVGVSAAVVPPPTPSLQLGRRDPTHNLLGRRRSRRGDQRVSGTP
jgi:hypothetical protein